MAKKQSKEPTKKQMAAARESTKNLDALKRRIKNDEANLLRLVKRAMAEKAPRALTGVEAEAAKIRAAGRQRRLSRGVDGVRGGVPKRKGRAARGK